MKVKAQMYTTKGFYGKPIEFKSYMVSEIGTDLVARLDDMPDELEGEKMLDWTRIEITVER